MAEGELDMKAMFYAMTGAVAGALIGMMVANALVNFSDADASRSGGFVAIGMALLFAVVGYRQGKKKAGNQGL